MKRFKAGILLVTVVGLMLGSVSLASAAPKSLTVHVPKITHHAKQTAQAKVSKHQNVKKSAKHNSLKHHSVKTTKVT